MVVEQFGGVLLQDLELVIAIGLLDTCVCGDVRITINFPCMRMGLVHCLCATCAGPSG